MNHLMVILLLMISLSLISCDADPGKKAREASYPRLICPSGKVTHTDMLLIEVKCDNGFTYKITSYKYDMTVKAGTK